MYIYIVYIMLKYVSMYYIMFISKILANNPNDLLFCYL